MKTALTKIFLTIALVLSATAAHAEVATRDITISINDVFVPEKLDNRADAYVVVSGIFPNGCYRWKQAKVMVDLAQLVARKDLELAAAYGFTDPA